MAQFISLSNSRLQSVPSQLGDAPEISKLSLVATQWVFIRILLLQSTRTHAWQTYAVSWKSHTSTVSTTWITWSSRLEGLPQHHRVKPECIPELASNSLPRNDTVQGRMFIVQDLDNHTIEMLGRTLCIDPSSSPHIFTLRGGKILFKHRQWLCCLHV